MPLKSDPELGINSWLEDELYQQYLNDRTAVDESWKHVFEGVPNGHSTTAPPPAAPPARPSASAEASENVQPLRGIAAKIAENMNASVAIPLATSQRIIPVKVMDENRRIINQHRTLVGKSKVSYTHLIGWALVKALEDFPGINHAYAESNGQPARIVHPQVNLGIAVDVAGKDGARNLLVPNIKNAGALDFAQYVAAFDDLVDRARKGKLTPADFPGHHHFAHQSRHRRHHGFQPAPDARPGRHHRRRRHRLSRRVSAAPRPKPAPCWASAR